MRNITALAVLVIIFHLPRPVQAQDNGYAFSLIPLFGLVSGEAEEIVFPDDTMAELLSQLLWDMKPVYYYGLEMDLSRTNPGEKRGFFQPSH